MPVSAPTSCASARRSPADTYAGRDAVHRATSRTRISAAARRADARPDVHGQPARLRGRGGLGRTAALPATGGRRSRAIDAGLDRRSGAGPRAARRRRRAGARRDRRRSRLDRPSTCGSRPPPRSERGVWLRPFRNLVYAMPPYVCTRTTSPDHLARWSPLPCANLNGVELSARRQFRGDREVAAA